MRRACRQAVELFLEERIGYLDIMRVVEECCDAHRGDGFVEAPSLEEIVHYDQVGERGGRRVDPPCGMAGVWSAVLAPEVRTAVPPRLGEGAAVHQPSTRLSELQAASKQLNSLVRQAMSTFVLDSAWPPATWSAAVRRGEE